MKTYRIERALDGKVICEVVWVRGRATTPVTYRLERVNLHGSMGFGTGESGAGPADLAASILGDYVGALPESLEREWQHRLSVKYLDPAGRLAIAFHRDFKEQFIAPRRLDPGERYEITSTEIDEFLKAGIEEDLKRLEEE